MFWRKKNKGVKPQSDAPPTDSAAKGKPSRDEILAQARTNMASARAEIGDETLDKIKEALLKKQQSAIEQAKNQIKSADADKVRDHIQFMVRHETPKKK